MRTTKICTHSPSITCAIFVGFLMNLAGCNSQSRNPSWGVYLNENSVRVYVDNVHGVVIGDEICDFSMKDNRLNLSSYSQRIEIKSELAIWRFVPTDGIHKIRNLSQDEMAVVRTIVGSDNTNEKVKRLFEELQIEN